MSQRIFALSAYLFRSLLFSLAGLLYILLALAFYMVFFDPRQQTPDVDYYLLVIGIFGLILSFLVTLSVAARANKANHFPLIVRLPSRVEYLTAVFLASILFTTLLQSLIAFLALVANGPEFSFTQFLIIPPLWTAGNILFTVLSLHATDLVTAGWSRVYVYAVIGILLYLQSGLDILGEWMGSLFNRIGTALLTGGLDSLATFAFDVSSWFSGGGSETLSDVLGIVFWPFRAIADASINGAFSPIQALAPAVLLIYALMLFVLASSFFAKKDLFLIE